MTHWEASVSILIITKVYFRLTLNILVGLVEEDFEDLDKLKQKLKDLPKYAPYAKPAGSQVALTDSIEEPTYPIEEPATKEKLVPEITGNQTNI